jgi:hypothetical protein
MTETRSLTSAEILKLARVVTAVNDEQLVTRVIEGEGYVGTARHIVTGPDDYLLPSGPHDIRDLFVRVTLVGTGTDAVWPVSELLAAMDEGLFFTNHPRR